MKNILVLTLCLLLDLIILKTNINSDIYIVYMFPYLSAQEFKEDKYFYYVCIYTVLSVTEYLLSIL